MNRAEFRESFAAYRAGYGNRPEGVAHHLSVDATLAGFEMRACARRVRERVKHDATPSWGRVKEAVDRSIAGRIRLLREYPSQPLPFPKES